MTRRPGRRATPPVVILVAVLAGLAPTAAHAARLYVDRDAAGPPDGTTWATAYRELRDALAVAASGDEVWIAEGTYVPTTGLDRRLSFAVPTGVSLYGGFAGGETDLRHRDWEAHPAVLSGDIGLPGDPVDNSYRILTVNGGARLDGLVIRGGHANGLAPYNAGAGLYTDSQGGMVVADCVLSSNVAASVGGAIRGSASGMALLRCRFVENVAGSGGAVHSIGGTVSLVDCSFERNLAGLGGGARFEATNLDVIGCAFTENVTDLRGGPQSGRGAGLQVVSVTGTIAESTFTGNVAASSGGGLHAIGASVVSGCTFADNVAATAGGGAYLDGSMTVIGCVFRENATTTGSGGGMAVGTQGSRAIERCAFDQNTAHMGGGALDLLGGITTVRRCAFRANRANGGHGGAVRAMGSPLFENCTIAANVATGGGSGGGLYLMSTPFTSFEVRNCTLSGNVSSGGVGGGIYFVSTGAIQAEVSNSILWANAATSGPEAAMSGAAIVWRHSIVRNGGGSGPQWDDALGVDEGGNGADDPLFVNRIDPLGPDGVAMTADDGLRLRRESPAVDAGDATGAPTLDILGRTRLGAPDVGAYERVPADGNSSGWSVR